MMIIELFGIPGSGKTFYASKISEEGSMYDYSKYLFSKIGNIRFKIYVRLHIIDLLERRIKKQIFTLFGDYLNSKNYFNFNVNIKTYLRQVLFFYHEEKKFIRKKKNVIFDEGIIHHLISIETEFCIPHNIMVECTNIIKIGRINYIFINTSIDVAKERIRKRNRKFSNMDFLSFDELTEFLSRYNDTITKFKSNYLKSWDVINND